jgi:hypothetical protein
MSRLWLVGIALLSLGTAQATATRPQIMDPEIALPEYSPLSICRSADKRDCLAEQTRYHALVRQIWPQFDNATRRHCVAATLWGDYVRMFQCLAYGEVDMSFPKE